MSDHTEQTSVKDEFMKDVEQDVDLDRKKKELEVERVNIQYDRLQEGKAKFQAVQKGNFGIISDERAEELARESTEYLEAAAKPLSFINKLFKGVIPFFAKNLILICAKTGEGKSTAVANIVRRAIAEVNPATGRPAKVLVLTNEENVVDFYNRITCLLKGWHYVNHDMFTEEQKKAFGDMIKILRHKVTVIDDTFIPTGGATTTPEGIEGIFHNLIKDGIFYDVVILDYYQGITESSKDLSLNEYQAQRKLTQVLEKYRKIYPAPIVVMAQNNPPEDAERPSPIQVRIQGTKLIATRATTIIEMIAHRKQLMTEWFIHKGRYASSVGESIKTGYKNGLFVEYTDEFKAEVNEIIARREQQQFDNQLGGLNAKKKVAEPVNG